MALMAILVLKYEQDNTYINILSFNYLIKMFGISIFSSPEHFLAVHLGLFHNPQKSLNQLSSLLSRTKNPPISILQTCQLLSSELNSNQSHSALNFIRFLSQLSDISEGTSMSTSLKNLLKQSSFLTQIRHNLTHKVKVNPQIVSIGTNILKGEILTKYWEEVAKNIGQGYNVDGEKVREEFSKVFGEEMSEDMKAVLNSLDRQVTQQWLIKHSTNYQFKQLFPKYQKTNSQVKTLALFPLLPQHKKSMALSSLINQFVHQNNSQSLCQLILKIVKKQQTNLMLFNEVLVLRSLRKLTFLNYLGLIHKVIEGLPDKVRDGLADYWEQKEKTLQNQKGKFTIYRKFGKRGDKQIDNK